MADGVPVAIYCDGGVIGKNPSPRGGTWAYIIEADDGQRCCEGGLVLPVTAREKDEIQAETGFRIVPTLTAAPISNNVTEFAAMAKALRNIYEGWEGTVYSDSLVTICRFARNGKTNGLPSHWVKEPKRLLDRLGPVDFVLLDGHPTTAHLRAGKGKRGYPVHFLNVACDAICNALATQYRTWKNTGKIVPVVEGEIADKVYQSYRLTCCAEDAENLSDPFAT